MEIHLIGCPNPRQIEFFSSRARHTAYGGARGGGKSWAMRRKFVMLASRYEVEIAGVRVKAEASLVPMYDPKSERVRA